MKIKPISEITEICRKAAENTDVTVAEAVFRQGKNPSLTVFIEAKNGAVDLNMCENYHRAVDAALDAADVTFGEPYTLNVSSTGLDRPYKTDADFTGGLLKGAEIKLINSVKGKKYFEGELLSFDDKRVTVRTGADTVLTFERANIRKINRLVTLD